MTSINLQHPTLLSSQASAWIKALHKKGLEAFKSKPLPNKTSEEWKYTDPGPLFLPAYFIPPSPTPLSGHQLSLVAEAKKNAFTNLVFIDGYFSPELSDLPTPSTLLGPSFFRDNGWAFISFKDKKKPLSLKPYGIDEDLPTLLTSFENKNALVSLNQGCFQDGGLFVFGPQAQPPRPLHIIDITTGEGIVANPRYFFYFSPNSEASLVHTLLSDREYSYLHNGVWDFFMNEGAQLKWLIRSKQNAQGKQVANIRVKQKKDSQFSAWHATGGTKLERLNWQVELVGPQAQCDLRGVYALKEGRHVDHNLKVYHHWGDTTSNQLFKGILKDQARGVFNGLVTVGKGAGGSRSSQLNKNMLLNNQARVNTHPQLVIHNDDVKCTHGSTIGQIEEEELFYLRSRGLPHLQALDILSHGFLQECLTGLSADLTALAEKTLEVYFE